MASKEDQLREVLQGFQTLQAQIHRPAAPTPLPQAQAYFPPTASPGEFARAMAAQQMMQAQQVQMAARAPQAIPPPSFGGMNMAPGWGNTMDALGAQQQGIYQTQGGVGVPQSIYATAPNMAGYRPRPGVAQHSSAASSYFATPLAAHHAAIEASQNKAIGVAAGLGQGALQYGSALAFGAMGSAIGAAMPIPGGAFLGGIAGDYLGNRIGGAMGRMGSEPYLQDLTRARMIQGATPFVTGGMHMGASGQGFSSGASMQTSMGLRNMTRDHDFRRQTGMNQADVDQLFKMGAESGLLSGPAAVSPDQLLSQVRAAAKAIRLVAQVAGDPDMRAAVRDLSQMRQLGYEQMGGAAGAIVNRGMFSRMAGVSQGALSQQYGMPGAMQAQGLGMAGSTGYGLGMAGGGFAQVASSSGAFSDLQSARAGGMQGIAQTNTMASLGAANQDLYMAASLRRDARGQLDVDPEAHKRAQQMTVSQVAAEAGRRLREAGVGGISDLSTRRQEFKDKLAASQSPLAGTLNPLRQALGLQAETGLSLGGALSVMVGSTTEGRGMGREQREQVARTLELQYQSPEFFRSMQRQLDVERGNVVDRARSGRAKYRSQGLLTDISRGAQDMGYAFSDMASSPFRAAGHFLEERMEDRAAMGRGERVTRHSDLLLAQTDGQRRLMAASIMDPSALRGGIVGGGMGESRGGLLQGTANFLNYLGAQTPLGLENHDVATGRIAAGARGDLFGFSLQSRGQDNTLVRQVQQGAALIARGRDMSSDQAVSMMGSIQGKGAAALGGKFQSSDFVRRVSTRVGSRMQKDTLTSNAGTVTPQLIRQAMRDEAVALGIKDPRVIDQFVSQAGDQVSTAVVREMARFGDHDTQEVLGKTAEMATQSGGVAGNLSADQLEVVVRKRLNSLGAAEDSGVQKLMANQDPHALAYAALRAAADMGGEKGEKAHQALAALEAQYANDPKGKERMQETAGTILRGADPMTRVVLANVGNKGGGHLVGDLTSAQMEVGQARGRIAYEHALTKVSDRIPGLRGMESSDPSRALDYLATRASDEELAKLPKAQRDLISRYKGANADERGKLSRQFMAGLVSGSTVGATNRTGYSSHEQGMAGLEGDQASLGDLAEKTGAAQQFAGAVADFGEVARLMRGLLEDARNRGTTPFPD